MLIVDTKAKVGHEHEESSNQNACDRRRGLKRFAIQSRFGMYGGRAASAAATIGRCSLQRRAIKLLEVRQHPSVHITMIQTLIVWTESCLLTLTENDSETWRCKKETIDAHNNDISPNKEGASCAKTRATRSAGGCHTFVMKYSHCLQYAQNPSPRQPSIHPRAWKCAISFAFVRMNSDADESVFVEPRRAAFPVPRFIPAMGSSLSVATLR